MKTLNVKGEASINVKPTITRVSIKLSSVCELFDEVIAKSAEDTGKIKDIVESLGFKRSDLKTSYFDVDAKYDYIYDDKGNSKEEFVGYEYKHDLSIEFPLNNKLMGDLLYSLAKSGVESKFNIGNTVTEEEKEKYRDLLIKKSIKNAKRRAKVLAKAAGVELTKIHGIDYSDVGVDIYEDYYGLRSTMALSSSENTYKFDIDAEDITISDYVNVTWKIKNAK